MRLKPKEVEALFHTHTHQAEVVIAIYRMVFPQWDRIQRVNGWPRINAKTAENIIGWFMEFDKKHHPGVMAGGLWMNNGFSSSESSDLRDWEVSLDGVDLEMAPEEVLAVT